MSRATCIIPNCRKSAPATEPFCSDHRDKSNTRHAASARQSVVGEDLEARELLADELGCATPDLPLYWHGPQQEEDAALRAITRALTPSTFAMGVEAAAERARVILESGGDAPQKARRIRDAILSLSLSPPISSDSLDREGRSDLIRAALARWNALPDDERNGERPYIMGFNAGWEEALQNALEPQPIETAPKDDTMVWLLISYEDRDASDHPLTDAAIAWTIGFNGLENTGQDEWKFVGWCWSHDHFTDGRGKVLAWKPLGFELGADNAQALHPGAKEGGR
jgi:hypothetical protein